MKDITLATILGAVLGLFGIMGVGQMYVKRVGRGIAILLGGWFILPVTTFGGLIILGGAGDTAFVFLIVFIIVCLPIYLVWQVLDARKLTRKYNEGIRNTGRPPW
ncbi:MAG: hypothetical protein LBU30_02135 [Candidatus Methanoplasma sp.]|jgi:TM2 domain-containing membrane protein YozV|nr:hypothetical protein [Candidatus Methanoplasma sp.]